LGLTIFAGSIWAQPLQVRIYAGVGGYQHRLEMVQFPMFLKPPAAEPFRFNKLQATLFGGIGVDYRLTEALTVGAAVEYTSWSVQLRANERMLMPWVQFAATLGKIASTLRAAAFLRYQRSIGAVLPDSNWHIQTFSLGVQLSGDLLGQPPRYKLLRDTVYQQDTTTIYDVAIATDTVLLQAETAQTERYAIGDLTIALTIVRRNYVRKVPMPRSLLTATIVPKLVTHDGREDTVLNIERWHSRVSNNGNGSCALRVEQLWFDGYYNSWCRQIPSLCLVLLPRPVHRILPNSCTG